jgi:hypothetical protein
MGYCTTPANCWRDVREVMDALRAWGLWAKWVSAASTPLLHQNQPPDGSRPLMRRYVTKLP